MSCVGPRTRNDCASPGSSSSSCLFLRLRAVPERVKGICFAGTLRIEASRRHFPYNVSRMDTGRIAKLLQPFLADTQSLPESLLGDISIYIDLLLRWNARMNLTAVRDPEVIVTRHFGESLFTASHLFDQAAERRHSAAQGASRAEEPPADPAAKQHTNTTLADIGSGAGFPGVPIKLWAPQVHVTLIESNNKKATFLRELVRTLTLTDIDIQNTRAESLPTASFDVVTLRAVERFESILPVAAGLVAGSGRLGLLIGSRQALPAQSLLPGFEFHSAIDVPLSDSRCLLIGAKS